MDNRPFFIRTPKWQIVIVMVLGLLLYIYLNWRLGGVEKNEAAIYLDVVLFYGGVVFFLFFFAQFVLPVYKLKERFMVFIRLLRYLTGEHGPAVSVQNGELNLRAGEDINKQGPGIVIFDTASAGLLRTNKGPTRAVGPGVVFTVGRGRGSEELAASVDLRSHSQVLGPTDNEEPFGLDEDAPGRITRGLTRDAIEVIPTILVNFKLDAQSGKGNTQFGYSERSVWLACTREGLDPVFAPQKEIAWKHYRWNEIPGYLAVDIWRETLALFTLNDLFKVQPADLHLTRDHDRNFGTHRLTGLEFINERIRQRLTLPVVDQLDANGRIMGRMDSDAFSFLRSRGIRVNQARLTHLRLPKEVEESIVRRWESTWFERAKAERMLLDQELSLINDQAREDALAQFAETTAQRLGQLPAGMQHKHTEILSTLLDGTLQLCLKDKALRQRTTAERSALQGQINWLNRQV